MHEQVTLWRPDALRPEARGISAALLPDLLGQSAGRLRILALLYALAFFLAGIFPMLLVPADRALLLGSFFQWGPMVIAIATALLVAAVIRSARVHQALAHEGRASRGVGGLRAPVRARSAGDRPASARPTPSSSSPAPPSTRTDLPIPAALDQLVLSCLAKGPAKRPQSARELHSGWRRWTA